MCTQELKIGTIPAVLYGKPAPNIWLFVHGQGGNKTEAAAFAALAAPTGWQVLGIDLPEHGDRTGETDFTPWQVVPELRCALAELRGRWDRVGLFGSSLVAWFGLLAYPDETIRQCLFLSPVVDMRRLIENMLRWSNLSQQRLAAEGELVTAAGQTLYWDDYCFIKAHPVTRWEPQTEILYGENDGLCERAVLDAFVQRFDCRLQVVKQGEHWFHTPEQLAVYRNWLEKRIEPASSEYDLKGESEC